MWGFFGFLVVWPLLCLVVGWPLVWAATKLSTRQEWTDTTEPGKWDDRPPPKWHGAARATLIAVGFAWLWFSLPLAMWLTQSR